MRQRDEYIIRPIQMGDRYLLKEWGSFDDPIFEGYNYANLNEAESLYWYNSKQFPFRSSYFAVINPQGKMLGYIGIKQINRFLKTAKLGIVFDPNQVSKGYGTMVLSDFLEYYFEDLKMKRLNLEVNDWNIRARRLYEKMGFKYCGQSFQKFENQGFDPDREKYKPVRDSFKRIKGRLYSKVHKMSLTRREYEAIR